MVVRLKAVRPEVCPHFTASFLDVRGQPGQHNLESRRFNQILVDFLLRKTKCLEERLAYPSILLINLPANNHRMHDRENAGTAKVIALNLREIFEETFHLTVGLMKGGRHTGRVKRVDLTIRKHQGERLVPPNALNTDILGHVQRELLGPARL